MNIVKDAINEVKKPKMTKTEPAIIALFIKDPKDVTKLIPSSYL